MLDCGVRQLLDNRISVRYIEGDERHTMRSLIALAAPIIVAAYIGEWAWNHRRHWYEVPTDWRLPKIEVACLAGSILTLAVVAWLLGVVAP